jgi:hypothetical protein
MWSPIAGMVSEESISIVSGAAKGKRNSSEIFMAHSLNRVSNSLLRFPGVPNRQMKKTVEQWVKERQDNAKKRQAQEEAIAEFAPNQWRQIHQAAASLNGVSAELPWAVNFFWRSPTTLELGPSRAIFTLSENRSAGGFIYDVTFHTAGESAAALQVVPQLPENSTNSLELTWQIPNLVSGADAHGVVIAIAERLIELAIQGRATQEMAEAYLAEE